VIIPQSAAWALQVSRAGESTRRHAHNQDARSLVHFTRLRVARNQTHPLCVFQHVCEPFALFCNLREEQQLLATYVRHPQTPSHSRTHGAASRTCTTTPPRPRHPHLSFLHQVFRTRRVWHVVKLEVGIFFWRRAPRPFGGCGSGIHCGCGTWRTCCNSHAVSSGGNLAFLCSSAPHWFAGTHVCRCGPGAESQGWDGTAHGVTTDTGAQTPARVRQPRRAGHRYPS